MLYPFLSQLIGTTVFCLVFVGSGIFHVSVICSSTSGSSSQKIMLIYPAFYLSLVTPLNGLAPLSRPYVSSSTPCKMPVADSRV